MHKKKLVQTTRFMQTLNKIKCKSKSQVEETVTSTGEGTGSKVMDMFYYTQ
jgi:predicted nucleic-acid-binding Zn-ribbon protein